MPCLARWYAILVPRTPPPIITTSASSFNFLFSLEVLRNKMMKTKFNLTATYITAANSATQPTVVFYVAVNDLIVDV